MNCIEYPFDEVVTLFDKQRVPLSSMDRAKRQGKYRYYGAQGIIDYIDDYIFDGEYLLLAEDGENLKSNKQNLAQLVDGKFWVNNHAHILRTKRICRLRYFYYWINSKNMMEYVTGSAQPKLSQSSLKKMVIPLPSLEVQDKILGVIIPIDEKIKENARINKNLEQQGLALYKSSFINYAPYGGIQPDGWNIVSLEDVCIKITDGSHYSPKDEPGAPYPMYSVKDMETYGFNSSSCKHISATEFERMKKSDCVPSVNDILVAKDGSYLKEIFICSEQKDEAVLSSIAIFRPNPNVILPDVLLFLLKQPSVRADVADNYVSGSALPRIVLKDFKKYQFTLPSINEQRKIGDILHSFRMQIAANVKENHRLISLRDSLLPKLMSGEIDVSDIDF